jgi:hypothetical protein
MKIDNKKLSWILSAGLVASLLVFLGVMSVGLSKLSAESKHMVDLKVKSQIADSQLSNLEQTKKDVEKYSVFKDVAKTVIPNDKNQAETVLEINQMASDAGIALQSITFPASTLGLGVTSTSTAQQDATSSASTSKAISQAKPVSGIPGLYSLQLTITPQSDKDAPPDKVVTYAKMLDFLNRIENNRHTAQITQVSIQPASNNQTLSFSLIINIFIKP